MQNKANINQYLLLHSFSVWSLPIGATSAVAVHMALWVQSQVSEDRKPPWEHSSRVCLVLSWSFSICSTLYHWFFTPRSRLPPVGVLYLPMCLILLNYLFIAVRLNSFSVRPVSPRQTTRRRGSRKFSREIPAQAPVWRSRMRARVLYRSLAIVSVFIVCTLPLNFFMTTEIFGVPILYATFDTIVTVCKISLMLHVAVNPLFYKFSIR